MKYIIDWEMTGQTVIETPDNMTIDEFNASKVAGFEAAAKAFESEVEIEFADCDVATDGAVELKERRVE